MILVTDNVSILDNQVYGAREKRQAILNSMKSATRPARKTSKRIQAGLVVKASKPYVKHAPKVKVTKGLINDILTAWQS